MADEKPVAFVSAKFFNFASGHALTPNIEVSARVAFRDGGPLALTHVPHHEVSVTRIVASNSYGRKCRDRECADQNFKLHNDFGERAQTSDV